MKKKIVSSQELIHVLPIRYHMNALIIILF